MKVVVLNSGGLDSVVMCHLLKERYKDSADFYSLFFDYGQKSVERERECSKKVSDKLGFNFKELKLNPFSWSNSSLVSDSEETYNSLYLEMRNMIFLSYAVSYAQSLGACKVMTAVLDPPENPYPDATPEFVSRMSEVSELCGIEIHAPLAYYTKEEVIDNLSRRYSVSIEDFCSCFGTEKSPEDRCSNCELIEEHMDSFSPIQRLTDSYFTGLSEEEKKNLRLQTKIQVAKLAINDSCNLRCPFCLMNDVDHTEKEGVDFISVIDKLYSFGITNFDLFGKEPLFDDTAINIMRHYGDSREDIVFSLITNGKNLEKYFEDLTSLDNLSEISISYDGGYYRQFSVDLDLVSQLVDAGIPVSFSLDVHNKNWTHIPQILRDLKNSGAYTVYLKPIESVGGCGEEYSITEDEFDAVIQEIADEPTIIPVTISIPFRYAKLTGKYSEMFKFEEPRLNDVSFVTDSVCKSGTFVYVNYDGKVYGCGDCAFEKPKSGTPLSSIHSYEELKQKICDFSGRNCCNPIDFNHD